MVALVVPVIPFNGEARPIDPRSGTLLVDTDPSHYFGVGPAIRVEKAIDAADPLAPSSFEDADLPDSAPILPVGSTI